MKMKIGSRLFSAREEKKLNQADMADLLGLSSSVYSRLERNETSVDLEQVVNFAKTLQIPIQEFLPETIAINSNSQQNQNGHIGLIFGNVYQYADTNEIIRALEIKLNLKNQENELIKEKITFLENENENLKEINGFLREKTK